MNESGHTPVMLEEVLQALAPRAGACHLDATFGGGGHARALLAVPNTRVVGLDRDPAAVARGRALAAQEPRFTMLEGRFGELESIAVDAGLPALDGVVFDLGVSSFQLGNPGRGFSFQNDGPLDMRMSAAGASAADLVNETPEADLARLIARLGEEPAARRIARAIVRARAERPIARTLELAQLVERVVPRRGQPIHPATRTFQALRIAVNDELGELERGLSAAIDLLAPGGRLVVVSFHSLEDRIVKRIMREQSTARPKGSRHLPPAEAPPPRLRLLTRGAARPGAVEVERNPRARSARLRAAERLVADDEGAQPAGSVPAERLAA